MKLTDVCIAGVKYLKDATPVQGKLYQNLRWDDVVNVVQFTILTGVNLCLQPDWI